MNLTVLVGRLVADPEMRSTNSGKTVVNFRLAVDRQGKAIEGQPTADFFNCVAWGKTGEIIHQYFFKGKQIAIRGRLQNHNYTDRHGIKQYTINIIVETFDFIGKKDDGSNAGNLPDVFDDDDNVPF